MSQIKKESLSALLDNEADELEIRRALKFCEKDPALLATWERFNLVQALLHEPAIPVSSTLAQGVAAQIETEALPVPNSPVINYSASNAASWRQNLAKIAIAASVALVFIVGVQSSLDNEVVPLAQQATMPEDAATSTTLPPSLLAESVAVELDPAAQQRLREYLGNWTIDEEEPVLTEHIQDSPLFRLVNELVTKPPQ